MLTLRAQFFWIPIPPPERGCVVQGKPSIRFLRSSGNNARSPIALLPFRLFICILPDCFLWVIYSSCLPCGPQNSRFRFLSENRDTCQALRGKFHGHFFRLRVEISGFDQALRSSGEPNSIETHPPNLQKTLKQPLIPSHHPFN